MPNGRCGESAALGGQMMEERLRFIYSDVNEWLSFAEAKNGALLAVNGALILSALRLMDGKVFLYRWAEYYFYSFVLLSSFSALLCLISFLPQIEIPLIRARSPSVEHDNLLFYGHICDYDPSAYLNALCSRYDFPLDSIRPFEENLAESIVINSRISMRKYRLFRAAVWLNVTALVTPVFSILGYMLWQRRED
jgi:hypothetical protein